MRNALAARFFTLGCKLNQSETSQVCRVLAGAGIAVPVEDGVPSRLVFVNTCAVTAKAAAKSRHAVAKAARENPGAVVVAGGCLAEYDPESLARLPGVSYVVGTRQRFRPDWWVGVTDEARVAVGGDDRWTLQPAVSSERSRPLLKIQDGCDHLCTYCVIPRLRGSSRSVPEGEVLEAARELIRAGAREIVLTGVRITAWGQDLPGRPTLALLVRKLADLPGEHRIRLGSLEPWEVSPELLLLVTNHERVCKHLHLSLQHVSPRVLSRMGRPPLGDTLAKICSTVVGQPEIALGADLIVGFPGEDDADFADLVKFLEKAPIAYLHVFAFSPRKATLAAAMTPSVPYPVVRSRVEVLRDISARLRRYFALKNAERVLEVIPERGSGDAKFIPAVSSNYLKVLIPAGLASGGETVRVRASFDLRRGLLGSPA